MQIWKVFQDNEECNFDFNLYQVLAQRTSNNTKKMDKLGNGLMGMNGESGEAIDILKKHLYQGHELDRDKIIEEVGDVLWYIAETCTGLGISMEELARNNIVKLAERYPEGFDTQRSIYREDEEKIHG